MKSPNSLLQELLQTVPNLNSQVYFKASLTALSHAMEDLLLLGTDKPLVISNFQQERFYRQENRRYQRIAQFTDQIYVLAAPESDFATTSSAYEVIPLDPEDDLAQEWHLIIVGTEYAACIVCQEFASQVDGVSLDETRQFKGIWSFDYKVSTTAAQLLLDKILFYRPELTEKVESTKLQYGLTNKKLSQISSSQSSQIDAKLFTERLVTYLQSSLYKQIKAYRTITQKERNERLINAITTTIRNSLKPEEIFQVTVQELGKIFRNCRCLLYRYNNENETITPIEYEWVSIGVSSLKGQIWSLANHPLFQEVLASEQTIAIADTTQDLGIKTNPYLSTQLAQWQIKSCLIVPICYQENCLGILELHHCGTSAHIWSESERGLVEAIANQVAAAFIQGEAYNNLESLNQQLAALERSQSNLIAIVGHELRTPLSTILVCLESLANEPDMSPDYQQSMLEIALTDLERMRLLIQDFLTLSRLEGGWMRWQLEPISLETTLDLVISSLKEPSSSKTLPQILLQIPQDLPLVQVDGEGLTEVLAKLLDNACKFTNPDGKITICAKVFNPEISSSPQNQSNLKQMLEVIIKDTGRGIEANQLEAIFERFYQEENFLRRTIGGTGLGLAICRQIIQQLGGNIWAVSAGKNKGSELHFTLAIA
ncbi:MAG: GAF domain-containing protein [Scytonematopsis contorta HA4267-MV1]|jgi:DICT domain-containing protein/signal transduction histidine kinase|nr:GAF domain-containing protein [Scytonematopsis contorta HA4267-MV1]